jgi:hypothetical protein
MQDYYNGYRGGRRILSISNEMEGIYLVSFREYFCPNEK